MHFFVHGCWMSWSSGLQFHVSYLVGSSYKFKPKEQLCDWGFWWVSHSLHGHGKRVPTSPWFLTQIFSAQFFSFEVWVIAYLWHMNKFLSDYMVLHPKRLCSSQLWDSRTLHLPYRSQLLPSALFSVWEWWYSVPYHLSYRTLLSKPWISTQVYFWLCKSFGTQFCTLCSYDIQLN
jgi:hypothetical protein